MPTPYNSERNSEYARKYRHRKVAAANMRASKCQARLSRMTRCLTPLFSRFVDGHTIPYCPTCERKDLGICIDCGQQPVAGQRRKALRCVLCRKLAKLDAGARYRKANPRKLRIKEAQRMADPQKAADRLAYKKLYRATKPEQVAAYRKADYQRRREHYREYHRQYREERRAERAARELARYHGTLPPRTCVSCDTILTGRPKKCDDCKRRHRAEARAAIAQRIEGRAA